MSDAQISALILRNLRLMDEAASYLFLHISKDVFTRIDQISDRWVKKIGWKGRFNFWNESEWYAASPKWLVDPKSTKAAYAYFTLDAAEGDWNEELGYFSLTRLCGLRSELGLRFVLEYSRLKIAKPKWKQFLMERKKPFQEKGFKLEEKEGVLFYPLRIDVEDLIKAISNNSVEDALGPFQSALEKVEDTMPLFEALFRDAKKQLGAKI